MNIRPVTLLLTLSCLAVGTSAGAETAELHLFGGEKHDTFLGCLTCPPYEARSICSDYGAHGSPYSAHSIWNHFSQFGSTHGYHSPWNPAALSAPLIRDGEGNFYGYFTAKQRQEERTTSKAFRELLDHPELIDSDEKAAKKRLCAQIKRLHPERGLPIHTADDPALPIITKPTGDDER